MSKACPCNPEALYADCCEPLHKGEQIAQTPEQLMRSRYSAFALGLAPYLRATWHASTRPPLDLADNPDWIKLQVIASHQTEDRGFVHFRAFYRVDRALQMLEEKSRFVRELGQWFYLDGDH